MRLHGWGRCSLQRNISSHLLLTDIQSSGSPRSHVLYLLHVSLTTSPSRPRSRPQLTSTKPSNERPFLSLPCPLNPPISRPRNETQSQRRSICAEIKSPCSSPRCSLVPPREKKSKVLDPARRVTSPCRGALPQPVPVFEVRGTRKKDFLFFSLRGPHTFHSVHTPLDLRGR